MKALLLSILLLAGCGKDSTAPPSPPPTPLAKYVLTSLSYEDVFPGNYAAKLTSFSGGPAYMYFSVGTGQLVVNAPVFGVIKIVRADSTTTDETVTVLPKGNGAFKFTTDSLGVVTFTTSVGLWPTSSGAVLTDSTYTYDKKECFDTGCTDYVWLAFRWMR